MIEHDTFRGLVFHDDAELAALLGSPIRARRVVHEWPLTRTEELRLDDGRHLAYKCQLPPSVEPAFYTSARSSLLPRHVELGGAGECSFLVTEWIEGRSLHALDLPPDRVIAAALAVADEIARIPGPVPHNVDISTEDHWRALVDEVASKLTSLIRWGKFAAIRADHVDRLRQWAEAPSVVAAATADPRTVHGDLSPEEVFPTDDGWRVIDWQRPVRGPRELDVVSLLRFARIDPEAVVAREFAEISSFLLTHWAAVAAHDLLPDLPAEVPLSWAVGSLRYILSAPNRS